MAGGAAAGEFLPKRDSNAVRHAPDAALRR